MWRNDLSGFSYTIVTLVLNIGLVMGMYLVIMFIKNIINNGRKQAKYLELIIGISLMVITFILKYVI